jgi:uncharacterized protein GlcG (DUF336 family)
VNLQTADAIVEAILKQGAARKAPPLTVAVVDMSGSVVCVRRQDGSPSLRPDIAIGKARTCVLWGKSSRAFAQLTEQRPGFANTVLAASPSPLIAAAGGVSIQDSGGQLIGAAGVSGDTSDNDEAMAVAALSELGLKAVIS